jgi:hypothetical protein
MTGSIPQKANQAGECGFVPGSALLRGNENEAAVERWPRPGTFDNSENLLAAGHRPN